jgi:Tol biopolymer transport system component
MAMAQPATERAITAEPVNRIYVHAVAELGKKITGIDSVDWSMKNNRLIVDMPGLSRFFSVYTMTPEGFRLQNKLQGMPGNGLRHSGSPNWHPSGEYFIFTSQQQGVSDFNHSMPRTGWHCDIWLANRAGTSFWRLTRFTSKRTAPVGAVSPSFSPDGTKVIWAGNNGNLSRSSSPWRQKSLYIADFSLNDGNPELTNIREFQPGENQDFYESYGFSPDGNRVLFAANVLGGQPWFDLDICAVDRRTNQVVMLTDSGRVWDRFATYSADGRKILWSSTGQAQIPYLGTMGEKWQRYLRTELWMMEPDGRRSKQLTFFNDESSEQYAGKRVFFGDSAFSPDGKYVATVLYEQGNNFEPESRIIMLKLGVGAPLKVEIQREGGVEKPKEPTAPTVPKPEEKPGNETTPKIIKW